jgi:outer membrane lipoprotein-sorting protein
MSILRTASTRRLLSILAGLVAVLAAGTAIALATTGSGPTPAPKALPQAVHDALAAPQVHGITARISFTNHLVPSTDLGEGPSDPLLNGGTGRVWLSPATHQLRLELQGDTGDAEVVVNQRSFWAYDPQSHTVYEGTLPADRMHADRADHTVPSVAAITKQIARARRHLNLSDAQPTDVAGEPAYQVQVSPRTHPGLLGSVGLAWDALHGTPLRFTVTAKGSSDPVLELTATEISFDAVPASVFAMSPPAGAHVAHVTLPSRSADRHSGRAHAHHGKVSTQGEGLDGITVIRQPAQGAAKPASSSGGKDHGGVSLPTVSINGVTGQELQTPLGTLVRFTRGGTTYIVFGSQPAAKVLAAARGL